MPVDLIPAQLVEEALESVGEVMDKKLALKTELEYMQPKRLQEEVNELQNSVIIN